MDLQPDKIEKAIWNAIGDLQKSMDTLDTKLDSRQLSDTDWAAFSEMLEADKRNRWLWSSARTWAIWITAVVAGLTVGIDALKTIIKRLAS